MINSNFGPMMAPISNRFRDISSFPLKTHISHPFYSTTNLKMFPLHCISQILCAETESLDKWLTIHSKKFFPTTQRLTRVHPLYKQTDGHTTTTIDAYSVAVARQ